MKLEQHEIEAFFKLHSALLFFANTKRKVIKGISSPLDFKGHFTSEGVKLRDYASNEPGLIDSFVEQNPCNLSEEELKVVAGWKKGINDKFFVIKYDKDAALFYHSGGKKCYGVLYLNDSFKELLGPSLPMLVETWLVPFKGGIVYDGLIAPYAVSFGSGMQKVIKDESDEAIGKYGVIMAF